MTHRAVFLGSISFLLLFAGLVLRNGAVALMALPFLAYMGAGILRAPAEGEIRLTATRSLTTEPSEEAPAVRVSATIRNEGKQMLPMTLADEPHPGMKMIDGRQVQWTALGGHEAWDFCYTFQGERGSFAWKTLRATVTDPFGLFETTLELPAAAELQIQPRVMKFRTLPVRPDSTLHSPGSIPARVAGSGTDFWGLREYHPGDSLRRLDWRLAARHPRQLFTREFEQEEIADIALVLDARQKIDLQAGEESLFEHLVSATASLAEAFLRQGHRVSLLVFGDEMITVYPGYSKVQLNRILRRLAKAQPGANVSNLSLDYVPLRTFSSSALIVILSPLVPEDWLIFPRLRAHGNQGMLVCPDTIDFAQPALAQDTAGSLAMRVARVERRLQLNRIAALNIRVVDWQVHQPLAPLVRRALRTNRGVGRE